MFWVESFLFFPHLKIICMFFSLFSSSFLPLFEVLKLKRKKNNCGVEKTWYHRKRFIWCFFFSNDMTARAKKHKSGLNDVYSMWKVKDEGRGVTFRYRQSSNGNKIYLQFIIWRFIHYVGGWIGFWIFGGRFWNFVKY